MLEIRHKTGYSEVLKDGTVVARIYLSGSRFFVKITAIGMDAIVSSEQEALEIIESRLIA